MAHFRRPAKKMRSALPGFSDGAGVRAGRWDVRTQGQQGFPVQSPAHKEPPQHTLPP